MAALKKKLLCKSTFPEKTVLCKYAILILYYTVGLWVESRKETFSRKIFLCHFKPMQINTVIQMEMKPKYVHKFVKSNQILERTLKEGRKGEDPPLISLSKSVTSQQS